jgi:hypothetical protein
MPLIINIAYLTFCSVMVATNSAASGGGPRKEKRKIKAHGPIKQVAIKRMYLFSASLLLIESAPRIHADINISIAFIKQIGKYIS